MRMDIEDRRLLTVEIDSDAMVAAYPEMFTEFLEQEEFEDGAEARGEYAKEWISEVGLEDFLSNDFVVIKSDDGDLDLDVKQ